MPTGPRPRGRRPRGRPSSSPSPHEPERIHKRLAAAGIGSRREVERWIREGRLKVNGLVPALGARLGERDRITLDDRPVRLRAPDPARDSRVLLLHRAPGEKLDLKAAVARAAAALELPRAGGRWLAIQPLPPVDGGLELLTDDGAFAHRISRGVHGLTMDYVLRVRGELSNEALDAFRAVEESEGERMQILAAEAQLGAGANHWLKVTVRGTRSAQVRHWWSAQGLIVSRLMRVRFGPVLLSRDLPRGRARPMRAEERSALLREIPSDDAVMQ
ncbi:MAG TPA: S4 domain-containing protein [Steroidobacteraceae bacterium]|nr:S4 domain-containing protein [Steroidobacteraceae bacterium]